MKLVDVALVLGRVNSILLAFDEQSPTAAREQLVELQHGLEFYEEAAPRTVAPGVKAKRPARRTKKRRR